MFMQSKRLGDISDKYIGAGLYQATLHFHEEIALTILDVYIARNVQVNVNWFFNDGSEAFRYAAQNGLINFVKKFISLPVFDTVNPIQAKSALILAKKNSHEYVVDFLENSDRFTSRLHN